MAKAPEFEYIYIQPINKKWRPGVRMLKRDLGDRFDDYYSDFLEWMANVYKEEIVKAIDNQRYKRNWPDLSLEYYRYKERNNLSLKMWEATGFLKDNIEVMRKRKYVKVGFPFFVLYKNRDVSPELIARVLEYGQQRYHEEGKGIPPRPLWRPLYRYMGKHVRRFWESYAREV